HFRELLLDSCRLRMRSDVKIGTSLSGGLDSSSVLVCVSQLEKLGKLEERSSKSWHKTFIHSFKDTLLDETFYAELVANSVGVEKIYISADESDDFSKTLDRIIYDFESIYSGMPDGAWRVYKAQREHGVVVSLDGHGADEMLGGYNWYV